MFTVCQIATLDARAARIKKKIENENSLGGGEREAVSSETDFD